MSNLPICKKTRNTIIALVVGMMIIIAAILVSWNLHFNLVENLVMSWILTTVYALIAFFLIEPTVQINPVRVVERPVYQEVIKEIQVPVEKKVVEIVEKPIIKPIQIPIENKTIEVVERPVIKTIQIPVENRVVEVVEKEVIKEVPVPVEKIVYRTIEREHKKLNIPKFEFVGSIQTKTYHKRNCKFSRMLKRKYKLHSNSQEFFKNKHYHACGTCLKKENKKEQNIKVRNKKHLTKNKKAIRKQPVHRYVIKKDYEACNKAQFKPLGYTIDLLKKENYQTCLA